MRLLMAHFVDQNVVVSLTNIDHSELLGSFGGDFTGTGGNGGIDPSHPSAWHGLPRLPHSCLDHNETKTTNLILILY